MMTAAASHESGNIFLGRELRERGGGVNLREDARQAALLMAEIEEEIDPLTPVEELRPGQQQIVEIARARSVDARILIMDEPTSALSAAEVEVLFKIIRDLTARGVPIVYISHHLEEALQITDHAVVLRAGSITATAEARDMDLQWIVQNMVGDHYDRGSPPPATPSARRCCRSRMSAWRARTDRARWWSTASRSTCAPARSCASTG